MLGIVFLDASVTNNVCPDSISVVEEGKEKHIFECLDKNDINKLKREYLKEIGNFWMRASIVS